MKKLCVFLLIAALAAFAFGCAPHITVTVSPSPAAEETQAATPEPSETASPESTPGEDEVFSDNEYDLQDIMFKCDEPLEYYDDGDGTEGYKLSVDRAILLDVQQIAVDPDVDPVGDEEAMDELCEFAVYSFINAGAESVEIDGDPQAETMKIDGANAYYTEFDAMNGDMPVKAGSVAFVTENNLYTVSVIAATDASEYQSVFSDLVDSITIINHADYTTKPSSKPSSDSSKKPSSSSGVSAKAVETAQDYLDLTAFSRQGLIDQLVFEGFSESEAADAVDSLDVNWSRQAVKSAQEFVDYGGVSHDGLIDLLEYSGFSSDDAKKAVDSLDVDWREQAVICASDYIEYNEMYDEAELIDQLEFEGFSTEDARYGAEQALDDAGR